MKATLALNKNDEIAFFYGQPLGIEPEWASIDVDMGQIHVFDPEGEKKHLILDDINEKIYERIAKEGKILLVQVENDDATKPIKADWVHLMVSTQL